MDGDRGTRLVQISGIPDAPKQDINLAVESEILVVQPRHEYEVVVNWHDTLRQPDAFSWLSCVDVRLFHYVKLSTTFAER
jgi:hypothetical protein